MSTMATRLRDERPGSRNPIPGIEIFSSPPRLQRLWGLLSKWYRGSFLRG